MLQVDPDNLFFLVLFLFLVMTVVARADGSLDYDAPQNLSAGETFVDQFDYTVNDAAGTIASGLLAHWKLDGDATDSSPNGYDGTVLGSPATVPGQVGQGMDFPGNAAVRATVPYDPVLNPRGSFTVITGRIGSGKTTLLRALLGLLPAQSGDILWNGQALQNPAAFLVPPRTAYTPQVPLLFSEVVNLHPVAIIVAILVFGGLWGFWGVFFAIPLGTLVKAVLTAWPRAQKREQREALQES